MSFSNASHGVHEQLDATKLSHLRHHTPHNFFMNQCIWFEVTFEADLIWRAACERSSQAKDCSHWTLSNIPPIGNVVSPCHQVNWSTEDYLTCNAGTEEWAMSSNPPSKMNERKCSHLVIPKSWKLWGLTKFGLVSMELVYDASFKGALHKRNLWFPVELRKIAAAWETLGWPTFWKKGSPNRWLLDSVTTQVLTPLERRMLWTGWQLLLIAWSAPSGSRCSTREIWIKSGSSLKWLSRMF